ncbi:SIR2 family protein [Flavobacterium sp. WV_118_3]|uniref:SIR2 family protein n=1 Tax=Flavobacterium sp. WV_118_3 TaxID=3151764 RepID=UPI00321B709B
MEHFFYKGAIQILENTNNFEEKITHVKKELAKTFESRNLSFLIGSGCSLGKNGIPTMKELADTLFNVGINNKTSLSKKLQELVFEKKHLDLLSKHNIDYTKEPFLNNLEIFLGTLYSLRFYLDQIHNSKEVIAVDEVIEQTKNYILYRCLNEENTGLDDQILDVYQSFYRKLSLRDSNLPKPNIFTTNYDLYSEKAMDELGITYTNGFSGFIKRYFNPSIFNYALAEQMDISSFKWSVIDSFIYLFKIHGSVNWVEVEETNKLFKIEELQNTDFEYLKSKKHNFMIYPSPIKQNASLGSPYSDLFREFQKRITQNQSILITMGYSFSDEHINNLIYQALTIPTFRLVIFCDTKYQTQQGVIEREAINKLINLNDPRIWIIGSNNITQPTPVVKVETPNENLAQVEAVPTNNIVPVEEKTSPDEIIKERLSEETIMDDNLADNLNDLSVIGNIEKPLHYFSTIVKNLFPDWTENKIEESNSKIIELLHNSVNSKTEEQK